MSILLSIIIPVYNRQSKINRLFESLLNSSDYEIHKKQLEIIVIDDKSSSATNVPNKENILLYRNSQNLGPSRSRKIGYNLSTGKYIHFHDSDDGFTPNWLSLIFKSLKDTQEYDVILTARNEINKDIQRYRIQKYFHKNYQNTIKIKKRLIYRNCMGPLGGVIFSRKILKNVSFKKMASSQDWHMYIESSEYFFRLLSKPDISYNFYIDGTDRISNNSSKKILGYLQLSRTTAERSCFGRNIRLYYLYLCRKHIKNKKIINNFYKKNIYLIIIYYIIVTIYWRIS